MRTVLIVEDDRQLNDTLKSLVLRVTDTVVIQAYDRVSAEAAMKTNSLALMVVDVKLGDDPRDKLSGFTLLSMLTGKSTVAIVVSGMPDDMLPDMAISLQAFEFISKPITDLDFINKVEHALVFHEKLLQDAPETGSAWPVGLEPDPKRKLGLRWKGRAVLLSLTELRLVHCLIEPPNAVVEYSKLAQQLKTTTSSSKAVTTHMTGVRRRFLDVDDKFEAIDSEPGKGYVWRISS